MHSTYRGALALACLTMLNLTTIPSAHCDDTVHFPGFSISLGGFPNKEREARSLVLRAVSGDGKTSAVVEGGQVKIKNEGGSFTLKIPKPEDITAIALDKRGEQLAVGLKDH